MDPIQFKISQNKHLNLLLEDFDSVVKKIIASLLDKGSIKVLNIGGGYEKSVEKYLSSHSQIEYYCLDIDTSRLHLPNIITGDITDPNLNLDQKFDFIFTKDTFEHILNPWDATSNIKSLLKEDGYFMCIAPFAWRYHACPVDTYRYTHTGMRYLFERLDNIEPIFAGYKSFGPTNGWYKSKTDMTLNGQPFKESIEVIYIGKKNSSYIFDSKTLDIDNNKH